MWKHVSSFFWQMNSKYGKVYDILLKTHSGSFLSFVYFCIVYCCSWTLYRAAFWGYIPFYHGPSMVEFSIWIRSPLEMFSEYVVWSCLTMQRAPLCCQFKLKGIQKMLFVWWTRASALIFRYMSARLTGAHQVSFLEEKNVPLSPGKCSPLVGKWNGRTIVTP